MEEQTRIGIKGYGPDEIIVEINRKLTLENYVYIQRELQKILPKIIKSKGEVKIFKL